MKTEKGEQVAVADQAVPEMERAAELSQLFATHHRRVLLAAYRITGSMADAEDVAQVVFLRLAAGSSESVANPGSYLYRAAINGALDLLRRSKSAPMEPLESAAHVSDGKASPETTATTRELRTWLRAAISSLSPRAAEMFTLRYFEGCDNGEIAGMMNTSQAVVAVTLSNARSKLKKLLQEYERGTR